MTPPDGGHPLTSEIIERLVSRLASPEERQLVTRHLLRGCKSCGDRLRLEAWGLTGERKQPPPGAYDRAFARAACAVLEEADRTSPKVQRLLAELAGLPPEQQEMRVRNSRRFASLALSSALAQRSHAARYSPTSQMVLDARLAVAAAEAAGERGHEPRVVNDHLAAAWAELGNALRIRSEFADAEPAFSAAFQHLRGGTGDQLLRALVQRRLSSLRRARREFSDALALLDEAAATYAGAGDRSAEAACLIGTAIVHFTAGQPSQAIEPLNRAINLLNRPQHRALIRAAYHQLIRAFVELGQPAAAHTVWVDVEQLISGCREELEQLRWDWLRALIDRDLGLLDAAETRLWRVRERFLHHDLAIEAAVISLDVAEVYLRLNRVGDVVRAVSETIPIFRSLGITRELLAALGQLAGIARDGSAALALLRDVREQLQAGAP